MGAFKGASDENVAFTFALKEGNVYQIHKKDFSLLDQIQIYMDLSQMG